MTGVQTCALPISGAVDHYGVHGNYGLYAVLLGELTYELHHYQRADSDYFVVLVACLDELLKRVGNETLLAVAAVVGHQLHYVGSRLEFVLEDNEILVSEAYDAVDLSAQVVELLCDGVCDSAAYAAAYYSDLLQTFSVARNAEGSDRKSVV